MEAVKTTAAVILLAFVLYVILAIEIWIDRHAGNRVQDTFVATVAASLAVLMLALFFHFGRFDE